MTLTLQSGAHEQVAPGDPATYDGIDVGPGQIIHIVIGTPGYCANPSTTLRAASLTVDLPGGDLVDNRLNSYSVCGVPGVLIFTPVDPTAGEG